MKALNIENLAKVYSNGVNALKGVSFSVEAGDFFALLGPNGAGKSTTIGIITSLVNKTSGKVSVFGHDIDTELRQAKRCIGLVPQEMNFAIFETVWQIVINQAGFYGVPKAHAAERADYYLEKLGLWKKRHHTARTLSGGMKRRLMIARALIHEPKLLILDEPTAGVDIELRRSLWEFLEHINDLGITVILTTHYLEEAESLCRNIAIIHQGEIVENTDMKSLLKKLDTETVILYLQDHLMSPPKLEDFAVHLVDEVTLAVEISKHQSINTLMFALDEQGIIVNRMRNKTNRLEELFLKLTTTKGETC